MRMWKLGWLMSALVLAATACREEGSGADASKPAPASTNAPAAAASANGAPPVATEAQGKLKTTKVWIGTEELITEIASSEKEVMTGMMFRKSMEENEAMIFVFGYPHQVAFWMKNTLLPLSCAYIDPEGIILETHDMKPLDESPIQSSTNRVQYVLEVKQGWFDRHHVKPGMLLRTEYGSLYKTFFDRNAR